MFYIRLAYAYALYTTVTLGSALNEEHFSEHGEAFLGSEGFLRVGMTKVLSSKMVEVASQCRPALQLCHYAPKSLLAACAHRCVT